MVYMLLLSFCGSVIMVLLMVWYELCCMVVMVFWMICLCSFLYVVLGCCACIVLFSFVINCVVKSVVINGSKNGFVIVGGGGG